ncbi:HNH endonuclease [Arthrobacter sp. BL-252-APC-1A]|uniref:HNH endonuclease n=1 Tax=Arthrobacter sp. BL-252-APC-1A TaxID=2606622 RepID=UPI0012B23125|nr:HNH endonuclease [Arthrobacter sp. BL-252-APC-1A]
MLRRAENVTFSHRRSFWTSNGPAVITVGRKSYELRRISEREFLNHHERQRQYPKLVARIGTRRYWHYQDRFYWESEELNADQVYALITSKAHRQRQQVERAQAIVAMGPIPRQKTKREHIPDDLKQLVWLRDGGSCQACGSSSELQYDHVIPVALGGNSTEDNLQILCGPCNRSKSSGLTVRRGRP